MPNEWRPLSRIIINGVEYQVTDEIVQGLLEVISENNTEVSLRINDLNSRINNNYSYVQDITSFLPSYANVISDWNETDSTVYTYIKNKPTIPTLVKSDWNETDTTSFAYIQNKPSIPDDSNLVHKTGDETIYQKKTFAANGEIHLASSWRQIYNDDDDESLQAALNARNNVKSDWNVSDTTSNAYILNKPTIPDITGKADKSDAIGSLSLALDQSTYVITLSGTKVDGTTFTVSNQIDLPLESVVVGGNYNNTTKKVELTLKSGSTVEFSVADLVSGLQSEITSSNKLSADLIEDGTTNKIINVQSDWNVSDTTSNAYILNKPSIPNDSNLVHKTGNETISGTKRFNDNIYFHGEAIGEVYFNNELHDSQIRLKDDGDEGWVQIIKGNGTTATTLQAALDERNNVQSDWNVSDTTSNAYILNKPTIPTLVQSDWNVSDTTSNAYILNKPSIPTLVNANWNETDPTSPAYIQNTYIVTDELTYLRMAYTALVAEYEDDNYVISTALTDLDSRITTLSNSSFSGDYDDLTNKPTIPTLVKSDWNVTDSTSNAYILNKPTIPTLVQSDWNISDSTSNAYIQNKPTIPAAQIQADWNISDSTSLAYINNKPTIPTVPTTSTTVTQNDTNPVSGGAVYAKFADLIGAAPAALDTLQEIATALNNDADLAGTLTTQIGAKIPKVSNPTTDNFASFNSDGTIKDSTYSASSFITSIKTVNNESLVGSGNVVISGLPQVSASDNGKILMVVNGQWQLVSPSVLYTGQGVPNNAQGNNGDIYMQTD